MEGFTAATSTTLTWEIFEAFPVTSVFFILLFSPSELLDIVVDKLTLLQQFLFFFKQIIHVFDVIANCHILDVIDSVLIFECLTNFLLDTLD
jgi:hypothetical protein